MRLVITVDELRKHITSEETITLGAIKNVNTMKEHAIIFSRDDNGNRFFLIGPDLLGDLSQPTGDYFTSVIKINEIDSESEDQWLDIVARLWHNVYTTCEFKAQFNPALVFNETMLGVAKKILADDFEESDSNFFVIGIYDFAETKFGYNRALSEVQFKNYEGETTSFISINKEEDAHVIAEEIIDFWRKNVPQPTEEDIEKMKEKAEADVVPQPE